MGDGAKRRRTADAKWAYERARNALTAVTTGWTPPERRTSNRRATCDGGLPSWSVGCGERRASE